MIIYNLMFSFIVLNLFLTFILEGYADLINDENSLLS